MHNNIRQWAIAGHLKLDWGVDRMPRINPVSFPSASWASAKFCARMNYFIYGIHNDILFSAQIRMSSVAAATINHSWCYASSLSLSLSFLSLNMLYSHSAHRLSSYGMKDCAVAWWKTRKSIRIFCGLLVRASSLQSCLFPGIIALVMQCVYRHRDPSTDDDTHKTLHVFPSSSLIKSRARVLSSILKCSLYRLPHLWSHTLFKTQEGLPWSAANN